MSEGITEADCAYLAALIDERGTVRMRAEQRGTAIYRTIELRFFPIAKQTIEWMRAKFKGGRSVLGLEGAENTFVTRDAAVLCVHAYPYLIRKKIDARLVTRFAESMSEKGVRLTGDKNAIRVEVERQLEALQARRREGKA